MNHPKKPNLALTVKVAEEVLEGRIIPQEVMERALDRYCANKTPLVFTRSSPDGTGVMRLADTVGVVRNHGKRSDGTLFVEMEILETPLGHSLSDIFANVRCSISTCVRPVGSITPTKPGSKVIDEISLSGLVYRPEDKE